MARDGPAQSKMEVDARLGSDLSFQARAYFDTVSQSMADHIDAAEANADREIRLGSLRDIATENARKMFYALTRLVQGPPLPLLRGLERYVGARASRLHHMLQSIMRPKTFPQNAGGF